MNVPLLRSFSTHVVSTGDGDVALIVRQHVPTQGNVSILYAVEDEEWVQRAAFGDLLDVAASGRHWLAIGSDVVFESDDGAKTFARVWGPNVHEEDSYSCVAFDERGTAWLAATSALFRRRVGEGEWSALLEVPHGITRRTLSPRR
jgi:hypothetical protein